MVKCDVGKGLWGAWHEPGSPEAQSLSQFTKQELIDFNLAVASMRQKHGITGLNGYYLVARDIDGDLRIAPMSLLDKMLWEAGGINANSFIKIKNLINEKL